MRVLHNRQDERDARFVRPFLLLLDLLRYEPLHHRQLRRLIIICLMLVGASAASASQLTASYITCYAGQEIFELCGHEALRIRGVDADGLPVDSVWNYGVFDFNSPGFLTRFVCGETDYMVIGYPFAWFLPEYEMRGSRVVEQDLNLTQEEVARLRSMLQTNALPANRTYRYNYVLDNCATRIVAAVDSAAGAGIIYPREAEHASFRDAMRDYHHGYPWYQFGIDLALGSGIDVPLSGRDELFAPVMMERRAAKAHFDDGRPLVKERRLLLTGVGETGDARLNPTPWYLSPLALSIYMLVVCVAIALYGWRRGYPVRWWYALFFGILGLAGCLIWFLVFISQHYATSPNILALWLTPLQLIVTAMIWSRRLRPAVTAMIWLNIIVVTLMLLIWPFQRQSGNAALFPLMLSDLALCAGYVLTSKRGKTASAGKTDTKVKTKMRKTKKRTAATILFVSIVSANSLAAGPAPGADRTTDRPKLVIGIVIDQLRTDYLEYMRGAYGAEGFNRLIADGLYLRDVDFKSTGGDAPTSTAMIYTGNYPAVNGVPSARIYDPASARALPALHDASVMGQSTSDTYSPAGLRLSTIADEIAVDGIGLGLIYAISADPQQSIIMAGHAGNAALWIDRNTGNWCSSTWYRDFPQHISQLNHGRALSQRIDTMRWQPMLPLDRYPGIPMQKRQYPFSYTFPRSDRDVYARFATSPAGNREVTDMAIECLNHEHLGTRGDIIDMLNVGYSLAPWQYAGDGDPRIELEDAYVRLDADIARLLKAVDKNVGLDNTLIFVVSTGYYNDTPSDNTKYRIPTGEISLRRVESLLNSFLSAKYGNGDYVKGIHDRQIYLDDKMIETKRLNLDEIRRESREFVVRMSGVASALTLGEVMADEELRLCYDAKSAGDILLTFNPGWTLIDDLEFPSVSRPVRSNLTVSPAIIYTGTGGAGKAGKTAAAGRRVDGTVNATAIAPTISTLLHIKTPNGSNDKPLMHFFEN